jgi:hypothetical protein
MDGTAQRRHSDAEMRTGSRFTIGGRRWRAALLAAIALVAIGCSGGASNKHDAAAEQAVRDAADAWNGKRIDDFVGAFTDAGLQRSFGAATPREDVGPSLTDFIGEPPLDIREITSDATDDRASVDVLWHAGKSVERIRFLLVRDGNAWKIDGEEDLPVEVPEGTASIEVSLTESAFTLPEGELPAGPLAFVAKNEGQQPHELAIAKIPDGTNIEDLLRAEDSVAGVEVIGAAGPLQPGETRQLVLAEPLDAGRYMVVCFLPDETDPQKTPFALKGMFRDFTIAPQ